ncbi:hypothetical protein ASPWEDRAFT_445614 [Aspergillus wentii DTO 134E9]|uniref:Uncharacterized protein n=1 Tax=Aspergillus wentii DTO 134E9 TaxID=1073089 RepID=A0A1L9RQL5_ASPWE|nr:uncharacterized protein ASPWEDRAFT_445614 [Aspergillus wentii DTO 134E9]KAI9928266.1 hypothetical protein MW887_002299 [Aspergillus wentii]OJJ37250.1 hypothetical protein ASPWEDRAFT_445614 [Aspergillus wentii DTO 134E9]
MMVPRAFLFTSHQQHGEVKPRKSAMDIFAGQDIPGLDSLTDTQTPHSSPVVIPPKRGPRMTSLHQEYKGNGLKSLRRSKSLRKSPSSENRPLPNSIASILEATAIPVSRRNRTTRESRRLPRGKNHVDNFSQMMMDGVQSKEDSSSMDGSGNTMLDILLSPPEENEKPGLGNDDDLDTPSFSGRSTSSDSVPSLDHDMESPSSLLPSTPGSQRSPLEKRYRQPSHSEDCAFDHPLLESDSECELDPVGQESGLSETVAPNSPSPSRPFPRLGSTFKSNLTASLRAIKSAAQTVSTFATPSVQPDDFLTRSLFTIKPELTDDRRPPPMNEPPSPALRRYLNPVTVSPAEMHVYHDYPHSSTDSSLNCPVSIQMQTYHRVGRSRGGRKSRFRLAGGEGSDRQYLPFDPEIPPMSRQREPRENSHFLRMVVLEMNMRRRGKLRDDIPPRARVWLPPRKVNYHGYNEYDDDDDDNENAVPPRWMGVSIDSM